ncbi:MAG: hypothetical protein QXO82_00420 [Candidatus Methanomethylicia archaeon]
MINVSEDMILRYFFGIKLKHLLPKITLMPVIMMNANITPHSTVMGLLNVAAISIEVS